MVQLEDGSLSSNDSEQNTSAERDTLDDEENVSAQPVAADNTSLTVFAVSDSEEARERQDLSAVIYPSAKTSLVSSESSKDPGHQREGKANDTAQFLECKEVDLSSVLNGSVIKLSQLADILQLLDEDEFRFLVMSKESTHENFRDTDETKIHVSVVQDAFERLKEHLFVSNFSKDLFHLQLCEQQKLIDETSAAHASLLEVQGKTGIFSEESLRCKNELLEVVSDREDLQKQLNSSKIDVKNFTVKVDDLLNKLEMAQGEISRLSSELVDSRNLVQSLTAKNEDLNQSFEMLTDEKIKLLEENKNLLFKNEKTTNELAQSKDSLVSLHALLRDGSRQIEEGNDSMAHENEKLLVSLAECKNTIEALELENKTLNERLATVSGERKKLEEEEKSAFSQYDKQSYELAEGTTSEAGPEDVQISVSDLSSLQQHKIGVYDDSFGFITLRRNLQNAEMAMQKFENEIESLYLQSTSLSRSANKVSSPEVSRLIHAFETKDHVDDQDSEKTVSSDNQETHEPYMKIKMVTENLRKLLKELVSDAENASEHCRVMLSKLLTDAAGMDRRYNYLREHTDLVEEANIELMVLYEVMLWHSHHAVAKENELLGVCDAMQKQELILKSEKCHLSEKLNNFQVKISELHSQLDKTCADSDEIMASFSNQMQTLQAEVADRESTIEEKWNSAFRNVLQSVDKLDYTVKTHANLFVNEDCNLDAVDRVVASIHGASKVIEVLHGQLDAAHGERQEILDESNVALNTLQKMYNELGELMRKFGHFQDEAHNFVVDNKVLIHSDVFSTLLDQLKELLDERVCLDSENKQLEAGLMTKARDSDELYKGCLRPNTIIKLVEEIKQSVVLEGEEIDADEPAGQLESLIYLLVRKWKETHHGLSLSKTPEMQLSSLQGQVEHLNFVLVQLENENHVFKQSLKSAEEDVIALSCKVKEKAAEVEQSEQRVASLREKLSIAVTKGKSLITQRDSLKQSLAETSKELEKCSQELLSKDDRVHELETKLRAYSEAGERMEALESELSYIRNSATALRESFLLKDSVIQRIEEILEDLELPEHFHSGSIIDKIDWLAKSVGGNSLPLGDWDQRNSVGGGSSLDSAFVGVVGLKEDSQPNSDSNDDLRRRYAELQNKFYGLAEQNEMLEQSLMERNNLVRQWEGIFDRVDMPVQLRSREPEDKIQWLESALSEVQNHCYSLQQKNDSLETFCKSLTGDLEDSQRRASELETAFQQVCTEKEILLREFEMLSHDNEEISKRTSDLETRNENLQNEANDFQEQKLRMEEDINHTKYAMGRLQELLSDALQDSAAENMIPGEVGERYLEEMLKKLLEKYKKLSSGKHVFINPKATEGLMSHSTRDFEEQDDSVVEHENLKQERDKLMLDNQSLLSQVEKLEVQMKELLERLSQEEMNSASFKETLSRKLEDSMHELRNLKDEKDRYAMKNQSLLNEVEDLEIKKKEMQELLNQEKLKSDSLRETLGKKLEDSMGELIQEFEVLKMKERELLEQLNKEEMKSASLTETMNKRVQDSMNELMIVKEEKDRYMQQNQSLLGEIEELELRRKEIQEQLNQEEQKSSSLREKLNVAVRKGKSLVQQRDSLKQVIENLTAEVEHLKSEAKHTEKSISEYEEQIKNFSTTHERIQFMESENAVLRGRLEETEILLQEKVDQSCIIDALKNIDLGPAFDLGDPVEKLKEIGKYSNDLHARMDTLEQESRKSKRAAELLLAELNEVQERNDCLQEELDKAVHEISELSKEKDSAENAKYEAFVKVEKLSHMHSVEKDRQLSEIMALKSGVDSMREGICAFEKELDHVLSKDFDILQNLKAVLKSFLESGGAPDFSALSPGNFPGGFISWKPEDKVFMAEIGSVRELLYNHSCSVLEEAPKLSEVLMDVHREYTSQRESCETMKKDVEKLQLIKKEKESDLLILQRNISLFYETCASVISEIESWKTHAVENPSESRASGRNAKSQILVEGNNSTNNLDMFNEEEIRRTQSNLISVVRDFIRMQTDFVDVGQKELKHTILNLRNELQEKDIQRERICSDLVNQIKEAETNKENYLVELQHVNVQLRDTQSQLNVMEEERKMLEQNIKELQDQEVDSKDMQQKIDSLTDALASKVQETDSLMQALDAEEAEMEELKRRIVGLESELKQKNRDLENIETSRAKALKKLSVTVNKFDELHHLSENLLNEVEKLQSQLQERDEEVSFLRQEVTRSTNDALAVTELSNKNSSDEMQLLLSWLESSLSRVHMQDMASDSPTKHLANEHKEVLQKKILNLISELGNLRLEARKSDTLLQEERSKVEEMAQKEQYLRNSLQEKESQLLRLRDVGASTTRKSPSEIEEVEQMTDKWATSGTIAPQVRSLRKTNNDQVAIAIDVDHGNDRLDDDDKAHGFKSLTTSKFVPRFTRPVSDIVDGLWMSCDRALMRQPALRLGVIIYWAVLHAMLTTVVV